MRSKAGSPANSQSKCGLPGNNQSKLRVTSQYSKSEHTCQHSKSGFHQSKFKIWAYLSTTKAEGRLTANSARTRVSSAFSSSSSGECRKSVCWKTWRPLKLSSQQACIEGIISKAWQARLSYLSFVVWTVVQICTWASAVGDVDNKGFTIRLLQQSKVGLSRKLKL